MLKSPLILILSLNIFIFSSCSPQDKHLFILSGQSNMSRLNHTSNFDKVIHQELGQDNTIIVHHAFGGQPIREWYKEWYILNKDSVPNQTNLFEILDKKIQTAINGQNIKSVSFIWMQGERDAIDGNTEIYKQSLIGLKSQIEEEYNFTEMFMVLGRINDYGLNKPFKKHWIKLREAQVNFAQGSNKIDWVNTDDLNSGISRQGSKYDNNIHMSKVGYDILGRRFAEAAIKQLKESN